MIEEEWSQPYKVVEPNYCVHENSSFYETSMVRHVLANLSTTSGRYFTSPVFRELIVQVTMLICNGLLIKVED